MDSSSSTLGIGEATELDDGTSVTGLGGNHVSVVGRLPKRPVGEYSLVRETVKVLSETVVETRAHINYNTTAEESQQKERRRTGKGINPIFC